MDFKTIVKPTGFDANLHKLGLFFPYNLLAYRNGQQYDFDIEVRDLDGKPDCKINCFYSNFWYRTNGALKTSWQGYATYAILAREVEKKLKKEGFNILGWYER